MTSVYIIITILEFGVSVKHSDMQWIVLFKSIIGLMNISPKMLNISIIFLCVLKCLSLKEFSWREIDVALLAIVIFVKILSDVCCLFIS